MDDEDWDQVCEEAADVANPDMDSDDDLFGTGTTVIQTRKGMHFLLLIMNEF